MAKEAPSPETLLNETLGLTEAILSAKGNEDEVIEAIADFLDVIVPMDLIVPGVVGAILEEKDVDVFEIILRSAKSLVTVDPEKKAARKARRERRKANRRARHLAKKQ